MLIHGASQAIVLSDIVTAAAEGAGKLSGVFVRRAEMDRDPLRAMRPVCALPGRKVFVAAELFTFGSGALGDTLLAQCRITLETVSGWNHTSQGVARHA